MGQHKKNVLGKKNTLLSPEKKKKEDDIRKQRNVYIMFFNSQENFIKEI